MPKKNPSTRWFFKDWHNDEALQLCSLAARGLWIELLGICAENDGYLLINGAPPPPSSTRLARYIGGGTTRQAIAAALKELEANGVFSRTPEGVIFNRRMVRNNGSCSDGIRTDHTRDSTITQVPDLVDEKPPLARNAHARVPAHRKLSRALAKKNLESMSNTESLNAARKGENDEGESFERPKGALEPRSDGPIMETPAPAGASVGGTSDGRTSLPSPASDALKANAGRIGTGTAKGECDARTSQAPATDHPQLAHSCQADRAPIVGGRSTSGLAASPGGSPVLAASSPSTRLGTFHGRNCRPARAARPRPPPLKTKKPDFVKFQLLPAKQGNAFLEHERYDMLADYFAAVDLDHETKTPRHPIAFQSAIDAASAFIRRGDWTARSPFAPAPPTPVPKLDNVVLRRPGQSTWNAIVEQCRA